MVDVSIKDLEDLCFETGKLAEKELAQKVKIINLANILGSQELSEKERESYIADRKFVQEKMEEYRKQYAEINKRRLEINAKINDAVKKLQCQN